MIIDCACLCLQIAKEHGIKFYETSAKNNINIETAFIGLALDILHKVRAMAMIAYFSLSWMWMPTWGFICY